MYPFGFNPHLLIFTLYFGGLTRSLHDVGVGFGLPNTLLALSKKQWARLGKHHDHNFNLTKSNLLYKGPIFVSHL